MPRLILVRHGETEWSREGRHTGRTDLALTAKGEGEAQLARQTLRGWSFGSVFASPLLRAHQTAHLAGFDPELDGDLVEWDYGEIEGRTHDEIVSERPGWSKWFDEVPGGEQADHVGVRADRFIARVVDAEADSLIFAHGHFLAILIARWLDLDAAAGRHFPLATATVSVLSAKRTDHVVETVNHRCGDHLDPVDRPG